MILSIDTSKNEITILILKDKKQELFRAEFAQPHRQAEQLLIGIDKLLKQAKIKKNQLTGIEVKNQGESMTALRIGVTIANTLAYALGIKIVPGTINFGKYKIAVPEYNRAPDIGKQKKALS